LTILVFVDGKGFVRYVIASVDSGEQTANLHAPGADGGKALIRDVPWTMIHHLDSSQNALRIARESTENK
jgi:hypothetical protein